MKKLFGAVSTGCLVLVLLGSSRAQAAVQEVVIAFKTHFDIGYTDMASNVVQRYRTRMIDDALRVVEQNRSLPREQQFVWTIPGWPATKILEDWPGQSTERQQKVQKAFKEGRFVVHALPFSMHTELLEPEDLVSGLGYSSRLARSLALELPRDAKMTDVPCHSWILPSLLHRAGVDFLHLGCNAASSSPQVPLLFWWVGPDGSRLLTMYSAAGYGTGLIPPVNWPYHTWLALIQTGDNHGPPRPEEVGKLLAEAREKLPGVKVRIGRLSDFADAILAEKATIPEVRGDMPDTWIHGPVCDPAGAKLARNLRPLLGVTESLHTQLSGWGVPGADPAPALARAHELSLLYGEHTWGGALYWVTKYGKDLNWHYGEQWKAERAAGRFSRLEASWAEHSAYIETARQLAEPVLANELKSLAQAVHVSGRRIVVFNPLPWKRDGLVCVPGTAPAGVLQPVEGAERLPTWTEGNNLCFVARNLPPSGYRAYRWADFSSAKVAKTKVRADAAQRCIESPFFRAVLDPSHGAILSLLDKRTGRELVESGAEQGFGQYLYERFDADRVAAYQKAYVKIKADWADVELSKPAMPPSSQVPYRAVSPKGCSLNFEETAGRVTAVMKSAPDGRLAHAVTTRLTLYADLPYADLEITLHDKPADPWPEAGWLCLPFKLEAPQFRLGRLGGIVDPARDIVPGANHDLAAIHTGVALWEKQGSGVGLCALDSPLISLERPGCFRYTPEFIPRKPTVYVNLFNNQWSTNFRLWNSGTWTSRVRLWSFAKYEPNAGLITPALEARLQLLASVAEGEPGPLPAAQSGLALSRKGIEVTAFGPNPDGPGFVLRLWESAGISGTCRVELPAGLTAQWAHPVDLRGRPVGQPIRIRHQAFRFPMAAYAPASFRF